MCNYQFINNKRTSNKMQNRRQGNQKDFVIRYRGMNLLPCLFPCASEQQSSNAIMQISFPLIRVESSNILPFAT